MACAALLVIVTAAAFWRVLAILIEQWSTDDTYSFGALVPLISAYFVWSQRHRLAGLTVAPGIWAGTLLVSSCGLMLAVGRVIGVIGVQEIAMVLIVPAAVWLLCGRRYVFALWFPLLYLLLMLPVWEIFTDRFHYRSQLFSALVGEQLLSTAGVPVHRSETFLELPNITLEVASVCSGINFLVAVMAMGVPQAYLFLKGFVPRALVIAFALTIALFSNGLRIAIIGLLSHYQLTKNIHGPGHLLQGMFVSALGLIALHAAVVFMARRYPKPQHRTVIVAPRAIALPRWRLLAAVSAACVVVLTAAGLQPRELAAASIGSADYPSRLASKWHLLDASVPIPFVTGGPHRNMGRTFLTAPGHTVDVFTGPLVYVEPAGGLGYRRVTLPTQTALSEMPIPTSAGTVFVNRVSFRQADRETELAFWYDTNGAATSQVTTAKLTTLWSLVTGARPLPALVVITRIRMIGADDRVEPMERTVADVIDALNVRHDGGR